MGECMGGNHVFAVEHPMPRMTCLCGELTVPSDVRYCLNCRRDWFLGAQWAICPHGPRTGPGHDSLGAQDRAGKEEE